jgi:hypothetical protein
MKKEPAEIDQTLRNILSGNTAPLKIRTNTETNFEVAGTKATMQGRQKVDGMYFASVVPKPKDVRFYFFPIYTHPAEFDTISENLRKHLKGKSCFHFKNLDAALEQDIQQMVAKGLAVYQKEGLV